MNQLLILPTAGLLAIPAMTAEAKDAAKATSRSNIIYILADDLGYGDLGCLGQCKIRTPNIDRMANEGMLFLQHYAGCAVSAPSRSVLLTGMHTGHTPIRGNKAIVKKNCRGQQPLPPNTYTIADMFHEAGYTTGIFGKWGLGYPGSDGTPPKQGFDEFFGYYCQALAHRYYPDHLWHNDDRIDLAENADYARQTFSADLIHKKALEFIETNTTRPFFLFLSYTLPHAELTVPEDEIITSYRGAFPEKPFVPGARNEYGPGMLPGGYASQTEPLATYAAMVTRLDKYVGEVMRLLHESGMDRNTIVIFSSDNGPHNEGGASPHFFNSAGPFRGIKRDLYEGGIRVPLIVYGPGIVPGVKSNHVCAFWDIMPTFADMIGITLPAEVHSDGISFYPALTEQGKQAEHAYLYWEFHEHNGAIAVRQGDWKAIRHNACSEKARTELYNLATDHGEKKDSAAAYPDKVAELERLMQTARTESEIFPFHAVWQ